MGRRRALPTYLELEELDALFAAAEPQPRLYFLLCYRAGLRAFETARLRWGDFQWRADLPASLRVRYGKRAKEALLPVDGPLAEALRTSHHLGNNEWLFPATRPRRPCRYCALEELECGHISTRTAQWWIVAAAAAAGIERRKAHLHALRHSYATHLVRGGANLRDVQDLLRHDNIQTTSRYLHSNPDRLRDAQQRLP